MYFKSIRLRNFRNYETCDVEFGTKMTVLVGKNGQGKTNVLEAIYVLSQLESFRTSDLKNCIREGQDAAFIRGDIVDSSDIEQQVEVQIFRDRPKKIILNQKPTVSRKYLNHFGVVIFSPKDHELVRDGSAERRHFLDQVCQVIFPEHDEDCQQYKKILRHRTRVLKSEFFDRSQLELWTEQMLKYAPRIIWRRIQASQLLIPYTTAIYRTMSHGHETVSIIYQNGRYDQLSEAQIRDQLVQKLREREAVERAAQRNLVGPHLDAVTFLLDERDAREFSSQGQSRSLIISLKLAHADLIKKRSRIRPIFIADDIASELDESRRQFLLNYLKSENIQILLSSAEAHFVEAHGDDCQLFEIKPGQAGPILERMNGTGPTHNTAV